MSGAEAAGEAGCVGTEGELALSGVRTADSGAEWPGSFHPRNPPCALLKNACIELRIQNPFSTMAKSCGSGRGQACPQILKFPDSSASAESSLKWEQSQRPHLRDRYDAYSFIWPSD